MPTYLDFTVSLQDVLPRPWRRFLVPERSTFAMLHSAIQDACGWASSHLYDFRAVGQAGSRVIAGMSLENYGDDVARSAPDAATARLTSYFGPDNFTTCLYVYDFGDSWHHDVQLNDVVTLAAKFPRRLLGGEHAFPPDDSGGPSGYEQIQLALRTGMDPDGLLEWASETWEWTGTFDLEDARKRFARRRGR